MTDTREDDGAADYSPRRIRFLLLHWEVLASFGQYRGYAHAAMLQTVREWERLQDDGKDSFDCLCVALNDGLPTVEALRGGGVAGPGSPLGVTDRAALESAADLLPLPWQATRRIFELQLRPDVWAARLAQHRALGMPRRQDRRPELPFDPPHGPERERCENPFRCGSGALAVGMMALSLGWCPAREHAA